MACERTSIIARRLVAAHHQGLHAMGTHHSGRVPGPECPIAEMPPDFWKARRAHEALLTAQCAVLGAWAGEFPDRAEMLRRLARAARRAGFGCAAPAVAGGADVVAGRQHVQSGHTVSASVYHGGASVTNN